MERDKRRGLRANQRETWNDRRFRHVRNEPTVSYLNANFHEFTNKKRFRIRSAVHSHRILLKKYIY